MDHLATETKISIMDHLATEMKISNKNLSATEERGADVTVTIRQYRRGMVEVTPGCERIDYGKRMTRFSESDVVVSATMSPNFTLTKELVAGVETAEDAISSEKNIGRLARDTEKIRSGTDRIGKDRILIDLTDKNVLVAGDGVIATRRVRTLLPFAGQIVVTAPECSEELFELAASESKLTLRKRPFENDDLIDADLVLAATNRPALNAEIGRLCRQKSIPVNVSTDQSLCDFHFPSVVIEEEAVIGINASGKNHRKVKQLRQKIEAFLCRLR